MVAPSYAEKRSELARSNGLGQQRRKVPARTAVASDETRHARAETSKPKRRVPAKTKTNE